MHVRAKKHLGQHFLRDLDAARRIAEGITKHRGCCDVLEVGPGTGALTRPLLNRGDLDVRAVELDNESVAYLMALGADGTYVDCTFGRGGHSEHILSKHLESNVNDDLHTRLAGIFVEGQKYGQAVEHYHIALSLNEANEEAATGLERLEKIMKGIDPDLLPDDEDE